MVCGHALVSGFYVVGQKGEKDRKIPVSLPPLLLKSAPGLTVGAPGVEEKSRIRGNRKRKSKRKSIFFF